MYNNPVVSIVIPFYNDGYIAEAIESALMQTYPHIEIIVVDDGSTQHTELITPYKDRILYLPKVNGGTATALNTGIVHAKGRYFAWLSSDDAFLPNKVETQVKYMMEKQLSFTHSAYHYMNVLSQETETMYPNLGRRSAMIQTLLSYCPINGCTVMLDMQVFSKVGLFNPNFRYAHDYEMWLRLLPHFELGCIDIPLIKYRMHDQMGTARHSQEIAEEVVRIQNLHRPALLSSL
ncbi:glycosyltransferase [Paenibacillus sp. Marseille-Q4541]|uniref:glycosyltransferase n=1 Tax=Paenibacillus sp. Marseille-Q4541 TaxID=2831522 RepID=UPI001BAA6AD6|nr:glycosyltransferase [Paenibacillus sp. Marseille-Q4541]